MPGAVARTSTIALSNVTLSYGLQLANLGLVDAVRANAAIALGVNTYKGKITYHAVAEGLDRLADYTSLDELI